MSAVPVEIAPQQAAKGSNVVIVHGRIQSRARADKLWFTKIITPAPDPYSRPQVLEARSASKLGEPGDDVKVLCRLGGYLGKPFEAKDKDTGEITRAQKVIVTLDVID